ncbi:MAG TPA: serine/threonine protein kinase, partial [Spirochaetia bacterium]|nr:serine/threonine protein kinase [Spirochaetia bacterium]
EKYVVKFYRPGRWTKQAIEEEHLFLMDCREAEIPVVPPLSGRDAQTLFTLSLGEETFYYSLFPQRGGRNFEANTTDDWHRLGNLIGRVHHVGARRKCLSRLDCLPAATTRPFVKELEASDLVPPEQAAELFTLLEAGLSVIDGLFDGVLLQRIHGDCHAGNILDRGAEGLLLFDFDDMMNGPAVQDLWLLLPEHAARSRRELDLLLEGYTQFHPFAPATLRLIEPLRFMRMVYFLLWCARQRHDYDFARHFPDWGGKAFWIKEIEDFRQQMTLIEDALG